MLYCSTSWVSSTLIVSPVPFTKTKISRQLLGYQVSQSDRNLPSQIVVVVHGIGDPEPGKTLGILSRSMADQERPYVESPRTTWLLEKSNLSGQASGDSDVKTFPVHQANVYFENRHIELCEAFWGDLSRVNRGWLGVLRGIFQIIFGLRYVAYVAGDQSGKAAFWLKRLGLMSSGTPRPRVGCYDVFGVIDRGSLRQSRCLERVPFKHPLASSTNFGLWRIRIFGG